MLRVLKKLKHFSKEYGCVSPSLLNFAVTDGQTVIATRFVDQEELEPATLYFSSGTKFRCTSSGDYEMLQEDKRNSVVIVSSEPLTEAKNDWVVIPNNHMITIHPDLTVELHPIDLDAVEQLCDHPTLTPSAEVRKEALNDREGQTSIVVDQQLFACDHLFTGMLACLLLKTLGNQDTILSVCFLKDSVITGAHDGWLRLWSLKTHQQLAARQAHVRGVLSIVAPDPRHICSSSADGLVKVSFLCFDQWEVQQPSPSDLGRGICYLHHTS
jgi:WD40 repeat protein